MLAHPVGRLAIAIISVEEEFTGWYTKVRKFANTINFRSVTSEFGGRPLLWRFQILSFTEPAIVRYESLRAAHRKVGKNDLRISAIAIEHGAIVADSKCT